jgi:hypothetical protein
MFISESACEAGADAHRQYGVPKRLAQVSVDGDMSTADAERDCHQRRYTDGGGDWYHHGQLCFVTRHLVEECVLERLSTGGYRDALRLRGPASEIFSVHNNRVEWNAHGDAARRFVEETVPRLGFDLLRSDGVRTALGGDINFLQEALPDAALRNAASYDAQGDVMGVLAPRRARAQYNGEPRRWYAGSSFYYTKQTPQTTNK